jgi:hypothetical protein
MDLLDHVEEVEVQVEDHTEVDQAEVKFEDFVGEGKKYRDPDAVAKAILAKDQFIEALKRENAEMRQTVSERTNMEEFLERLEAAKTPSSPSTPVTTPREQDGKEAAVTPEAVLKLIEEREAKKQVDANLNEVTKQLKVAFGANWKQEVQKKAEQLGTDTKWLTSVAAKSPQAVFKLLGVEQVQGNRETFTPPPRSSVSGAPPVSRTSKDYDYWNAQRQSKGEAWYFSIPVQQERMKALKEMGDAFYRK